LISSSYRPFFEDETGKISISSSRQGVSEDEMHY